MTSILILHLTQHGVLRRWQATGIRWRCCCYIFYSLCCVAAVAAEPPAMSPNYIVDSWSTRHGLPHNTINAINQTADGYLWLATWEGPVRYNGREFVVFNRSATTALKDAGIRSFHLADDNRLYLGGVNGNLLQWQQQQWATLLQLDSMIFDMLQDSHGNLWLATAGSGISHISPSGQHSQLTRAQGLPGNIVHQIAEGPNGDIWLATNGGLARFTPDSLQPVISPQLADIAVYQLIFGARGDFYIATAAGVYRQNHTEDTLTRLTPLPATVMLLDQQQQLWLGAQDRGLFRLTEQGAQPLDLDNSLTNSKVLSLFQDREHSIWIGTNNGLKRLRQVPFSTISSQQGLPDNFVRTVLEHSDGSLWIGSNTGLSRLDANGQNRVQPLLQQHSVLSLAEDQAAGIWIGTRNDGLLYWHNGQLEQRFGKGHFLSNREIRAIGVSPQGKLWLGTSDGLYQLQPHNGSIEKMAATLPNEYILSLLALEQQLFIGTNQGAYLLQQQQLIAITPQHDDAPRRILGLHADPARHSIWLATDRGLGRYRQDNGQFRLLGLEAGLTSETVLQVVADDEDNFWLSSNRGIVRLSQQQAHAWLDNPQSPPALTLFNEKDGMLSAQANGGSVPAAIKRRDGSIAVATAGGVALVQPAGLSHFTVSAPLILIESIRANGRQLDNHHTLALPAGTNRISIQLAGLGFLTPENIKFRTRLTGFDHDWTERAQLSLSEYTNLPPGQYHFQAEAAYQGGDWSEQPAELTFSIAPFYWQQKWFWLVIALLLLAALSGILRWRAVKTRQTERYLQQQVAEKTRTLQLQTQHLLTLDKERVTLLDRIQQQADFFARQARQDTLTGIANRRAFVEIIDKEFVRINRYPHPLCVAIIDIDHFKAINDTWSHAAGDDVLQRVANSLTSASRETDTVARWGGEEFVILLTETSQAEATVICERMRLALSKTDYSDIAPGLTVTASFGLAQRLQEQNYTALIARADQALYQAKQTGRNRLVIAS